MSFWYSIQPPFRLASVRNQIANASRFQGQTCEGCENAVFWSRSFQVRQGVRRHNNAELISCRKIGHVLGDKEEGASLVSKGSANPKVKTSCCGKSILKGRKISVWNEIEVKFIQITQKTNKQNFKQKSLTLISMNNLLVLLYPWEKQTINTLRDIASLHTAFHTI